MKKWIKIVLFSILGLIVAILLALQILLHSRVTTNFVNKLVSENIDGTVRFSDLHFNVIKSFPLLRVTVDSLSLTYPHERYSRFDAPEGRDYRLDAGRGDVEDTLATLSNFSAKFNYWQLLEGHICLNEAELDNFVIYAHAYDDSTANWQLFRSDTQRDTVQAASELPWITVGRLEVKDNPRVVYTDQRTGLYTDLGFEDFAFGAKFKLSPEIVKIRKAMLDIEDFKVNASVGGNEYAFTLDYLKVDESVFHVFDISLGAEAVAVNSKTGRLEFPLSLDGRVGFNHTAEYNKLVVPSMTGRIAHIPLTLKGHTSMYKDSTKLSVNLNIDDCAIDSLRSEYLVHFIEKAQDISTDARINLAVEADGVLSETMFPKVKFDVVVPGGYVYYLPKDFGASVRLDADVELLADNVLNASINELHTAINGLKLDAAASISDILGGDPKYKMKAKGYAILDSLLHILPASAGVSDASGEFDLDIKGEITQKDLKEYRFDKADIHGQMSGSRLMVKMPKDTIDAVAFNPTLELNTGGEGMEVIATCDSMHFNMGRRLTARLREMKDRAAISLVEVRGQKTPLITFNSDNRRAFIKVGSDRFRSQKFSATFTAQHRVRPQRDGQRRDRPDSLRRRGSRRDSLRRDSLRSHRADRVISEFVSRDLSFKADSSATNLLKEWYPSGKVTLGRVAYTSPLMPLRTRMQNVNASFDDNNVRIDSLRIQSGTSDLFAKVHIKGLRRMLMSGRGMIDADIAIKSNRLNINEIVESSYRGKKDDRIVSVADEYDESFVVDSIHNAHIDSLPIILMVVPGNVRATAQVDANEVDFAAIVARPVSVTAKMQDRKVQLKDGLVKSELGNATLNAFYSTQSLQDISMGVDIRLWEVSASKIIHLLPSVDSMMPALKTFDGNFDLQLSATSRLDENMNLIMPTLDGLLKITATDLEVKDVGDKLVFWTGLLGFKNPRDIKISDFTATAVAHDNRLEVFPFTLSAEKYKVALYGAMNAKNELNCHVSVLKSPLLIRPGFNLVGPASKLKFSLGKPLYSDGNVPAFTEELDNVHINMAQSILDIFNIGMSDVRKYNSENLVKLYESTKAAGFDPSMGSGEWSLEDRAKFDNMILDSMLEDEGKKQEAELDRIVKESIEEHKKK